MRTIERSPQFKEDYKREKGGPHGEELDADLAVVFGFLMADKPMPTRYRIAAPQEKLPGYRDCYLYDDLVLIYSKTNDDVLRVLRLVRQGL
ncbi:type II toxin-antitoxin system mRNA interferase toxin, RelE/StbE family [Dyella solisilvae]|uniref:Type II toxin-antitoxin system mRNA interferase toxin, RelE/StbE family n=1 Tax=Dyella solisilvae TaxID=1920168 RepID=A0A370K8N2_9GAMM|nr:type II toxin-antitoxin system mRNA interferase toxin, RelE/StbE family [Dyella solisilvae]RDI98787.1 type II toxin-antitoxin system mRNA interferase toxin, RelE/StbE family [Dyella solisilvae]